MSWTPTKKELVVELQWRSRWSKMMVEIEEEGDWWKWGDGWRGCMKKEIGKAEDRWSRIRMNKKKDEEETHDWMR